MRRLSIAAGLLILGGCHAKVPDDKAVLHESAKLVKPLPGLYRSTTRLIAFELPGADPQTEDTMRDKFGHVLPQTRDFCLTPAAAERGFEDLVRQSQRSDCTFDRFVADETRLSARMRCRSDAGVTSTVGVEGSAAPDHSDVDLEIVQAGAGIPGGSETISLSVDNRRIGGCAAGNPMG